MTQRLALTLAIAILLIVGVLMGEGGPIDKFGGNNSGGEMAVAEADVDKSEPSDVVLAQTQTPTPPASSDAMWDWFGESEPSAPASPEPQQQQQQPVGPQTSPEVGALDRDRMNLEE